MLVYAYSNYVFGKAPKGIDNKFILDKYKTCRYWDFGMDHLLKDGVYLLNGWCFDFRSSLRSFVVKQNDEWKEYYAPNKTLLRKVLGGKIQKVLEIK